MKLVKKVFILLLVLVFSVLGAKPVQACDVCNIYTAKQSNGEFSRGPLAGVLEQYTHFHTLQVNGQELFDPVNQYLNSSISQFYLGYNFSDRIGVQVNVPLIYRDWLRPQANFIEKGSISGLGDLSLVANFQPYRFLTQDVLFAWNVEGGVKFPTGDTNELKNGVVTMGGCGAGNAITPNPGNSNSASPLANHVAGGSGVPCGNSGASPVINGITGSEITLGTGSYDGIFGTSAHLGFKRIFSQASFSYVVRTSSDFGFEYEDDLIWKVLTGYYLFLNDSYSVSIEGFVRGWWNEEVYMGPGLSASYKHFVSFQLSGELPIYYFAEGFELAPDYRITSALSFHFPL